MIGLSEEEKVAIFSTVFFNVWLAIIIAYSIDFAQFPHAVFAMWFVDCIVQVNELRLVLTTDP